MDAVLYFLTKNDDIKNVIFNYPGNKIDKACEDIIKSIKDLSPKFILIENFKGKHSLIFKDFHLEQEAIIEFDYDSLYDTLGPYYEEFLTMCLSVKLPFEFEKHKHLRQRNLPSSIFN